MPIDTAEIRKSAEAAVILKGPESSAEPETAAAKELEPAEDAADGDQQELGANFIDSVVSDLLDSSINESVDSTGLAPLPLNRVATAAVAHLSGKHCSGCKNEFLDDSLFCRHCGEKRQELELPTAVAEKPTAVSVLPPPNVALPPVMPPGIAVENDMEADDLTELEDMMAEPEPELSDATLDKTLELVAEVDTAEAADPAAEAEAAPEAEAAAEAQIEAVEPELWLTGQRLLFEDEASGSTLEVTLVVVDRTVLPAEQETERGYTVRLPDGRERNTLRARLRLPDQPLAEPAVVETEAERVRREKREEKERQHAERMAKQEAKRVELVRRKAEHDAKMEESRKKQEEARRKHDLKAKIREMRTDAKALRKDMGSFKTKVDNLQRSIPAPKPAPANDGAVSRAARERAPRPIEGEIMRLRRQNASSRRSMLVVLVNETPHVSHVLARSSPLLHSS